MRAFKTAMLAASIAAMTSTTAQAQSLPRFDVEGHCEQVSEFVGGSHEIYNTCIRSEQRAYNALKQKWPDVSGRIRYHCKEVAGFTGGSYEIMQTCVQNEQNAAGNRESFSFD
ncbi:hypothetical protein GLV89_01725 [Halomonas alkaliantarctica]|nr:hypothetical protein [Halomonas alkaliantarctica]